MSTQESHPRATCRALQTAALLGERLLGSQLENQHPSPGCGEISLFAFQGHLVRGSGLQTRSSCLRKVSSVTQISETASQPAQSPQDSFSGDRNSRTLEIYSFEGESRQVRLIHSCPFLGRGYKSRSSLFFLGTENRFNAPRSTGVPAHDPKNHPQEGSTETKLPPAPRIEVCVYIINQASINLRPERHPSGSSWWLFQFSRNTEPTRGYIWKSRSGNLQQGRESMPLPSGQGFAPAGHCHFILDSVKDSQFMAQCNLES